MVEIYEYIRKSVFIASMGLLSIFSVDLIGNIINSYRNRKVIDNIEIIDSNEYFQRIFDIELKKLNLDKYDLETLISKNIEVPGRIGINEDKPLIELNKDYLSREIIRHELYHLYRWKKRSISFSLPIFYQYEEYIATNYSVNND